VGGHRRLRARPHRFDVGTVQQGARADLVILDAPMLRPSRVPPGVPIVRTVIAAGTVVHD
jgi:imidazolonepropionase-like amidohydrolase